MQQEVFPRLLEIARVIGLEIEPAESRGELIVKFPREGREPLSLRLSRTKAVELVLWLYLNRNKVKKEVEQ